MRFGGESQFGRARFGGVGVGKPVGYIIRRMLAAMERFRYDASTGLGSLRTLERLTGSVRDKATWDIISSRGFPAVLIAYSGGPYRTEGMDGARIVQTKRLHVVCIADNLQGKRVERVEGQRRNYLSPGLDNITHWCVRYMGRELLKLNVQSPTPVDEDVFAFDTNAFAAIIEWRVDTTIDLCDDASGPDEQFTQLGIVHTPRDVSALFDGDNITPNTDSPTSPATGYADLDAASTAPAYEE